MAVKKKATKKRTPKKTAKKKATRSAATRKSPHAPQSADSVRASSIAFAARLMR